MANNKMLIDASHPEETRVVVVRGNRIEEFDFEAQDRRQLRGNIYLAKVTRVEPSLQAAFIDYGGNRHGFLAFSEIHPDYYQIPAADRQALLDAEAEAAAVADDENGVGIEEAASSGNEEDDGDDAPKKRRRKSRRGGRGRKSRDDRDASGEADDSDSDDFVEDTDDNSSDNELEEKSQTEEVEAKAEEKPKPEKRARRPRKKKVEETEASPDGDDNSADTGVENDAEDSTDQSDDGAGSTTMAAMMEMDVISEDAPAEDTPEDDGTGNDEPDGAGEPVPEKPKRKPRARKSAKKADEDTDTRAADNSGDAASESASDGADAGEEEKPKKRTRRKAPARKKAKADDEAEADSESDDASNDEASDAEDSESEEKPKKRRSRRKAKPSKADADDDAETANGDNGATDENGKSVESVGQEDALEEVSVRRPRRQYKIQEVIRRRQVMLVQVVKEERGNKGAALTTYLSLAGRYSVLMPNTARGGGISRKITNPGDRKRLKEIAGSLEVPAGMGVILRTAGAAQDKEEIQRDFDYLMRLWENVRDLTLESSAPFLVYEEGSLIKRSIRDLYNKDINEVIVAGEEGYREAKEFMQMLMPGHGRNVKLYKGEQSLLSRYNVESQLDKMVTPQVTLKSGGYLIINQTEALVAIDVNSGKSTREHSIEATALQTNLEAAEEVARQLRLRDLAGLVVIDFIDMEEKRNNRAVERKLKECLKNDRARIQVGHISHFGLLEMSRQRIRASVLESTMAVCPHCNGTGHVRSEPSFALQIVRAVDDHLNRNSRNDVIVKIPPSTAIYILNQKRAAVSELEDRYGVSIEFVSDHTIEGQDFTIERGEPATRKPRRKEAVNPMEPAEEVAEDVEARDEGEGLDKNREDNRDDRGGKRQRGRGRGRGRNRDGDDQQDSESAGNQTGSDEADNGSAEGEDKKASSEPDNNSRKRGKNRKAAAGKDEEKPSGTGVVADPEINGAAEPNSADDEPKEPRRRTGRPGKKVRPPEENAATEAPKKAAHTGDSNGEEKRKGAPPREVKRRNTRRVKKSEAENPDSKEEPDSWSSGFLS